MRLVLPHLVASASAFAFAAAFLGIAPGLALVELLAVWFVLAAYFERLRYLCAGRAYRKRA